MKHGNRNRKHRLTKDQKLAIVQRSENPVYYGWQMTGKTIDASPIYQLADGEAKLAYLTNDKVWLVEMAKPDKAIEYGKAWTLGEITNEVIDELAKVGINYEMPSLAKVFGIPFNGQPVSPPEQGHDYGLQER